MPSDMPHAPNLRHAAILSLLVLACSVYAEGCKSVDATSSLGSFHFSVLTEKDVSNTGRPSFYAADRDVYLFHDTRDAGNGRWKIGSDLFGEIVIAYSDSWSVHPTLMHAAHDTWTSNWRVAHSTGEWLPDPDLEMACAVPVDGSFSETTFFFDTGPSLGAPELSGFYVEVEKSAQELSHGPLYVLAGRSSESSAVFMYRFQKDASSDVHWILGQDMGTDVGLAFVLDNALEGRDILSQEWNFLVNEEWISGIGDIITGDVESNVYFKMRQHRSLKFIPENQKFYVLKNFVPIPAGIYMF